MIEYDGFWDEWDYLIHLIRCTIHCLQPEEKPDYLEFERVYEYGEFHHVANIAFYSVERLKNKPDEALYRKWLACRDKAVVLDFNQCYAAEEIRDCFEGANIRWMELQGTVIKPLYPQPDMRTMSDIDFIIDREQLVKATELLNGLGYECRLNVGVDVNAHRAPNINVEVHSEFFPKLREYQMVMPELFATDVNSVNILYLYNVLHIAKHYFSGGCGIRRVLDIYFLNKNYSNCIDWDYMDAVLRQAGMVEFAAELSDLANNWFSEMKAEICHSSMAKYIMKSGLHGHRYHLLGNRLKGTSDSIKGLAKAKYILRRLSGSGEVLVKRYPILQRYKILYPLFWFHRAFLVLRPDRLRRIAKEMKSIFRLKEK